VRARVGTALGVFSIDVDEDEVLDLDEEAHVEPSRVEGLSLPLVLAADAVGSRVVAVVDRRPPLVLSDDAGTTWREAGGGLPPGRAVAIDADDPDCILYAARNRLYLSRSGGVFWEALTPELPEIHAVEWAP
jgi:hypothetical protein